MSDTVLMVLLRSPAGGRQSVGVFWSSVLRAVRFSAVMVGGECETTGIENCGGRNSKAGRDLAKLSEAALPDAIGKERPSD